ncbi:MAG: nickel pincer cofactor biosynthesis protein LarB [Deltaproteobacteria bacterium]|nr:MAG: nickel pincer cofactor biosynthesis protein LarB [Deltaproteobacteria bacterium]TMQ21979.1 MAG: nickel pincer cofactor biosynthesis protein LarB [Deltaproteobacteria bacterium]
MDRQQLLDVLEQVRSGALSPADAAARLGELPYAEVAHAVGSTLIDHHRELRTGVPEIVFGGGKTTEQIAAALRELARRSGGAIATRIDGARAEALRALVPEVAIHELARVAVLGSRGQRPPAAPIAVVCAGTSDLPVAEEAALVAEFLGAPVVRVSDVGVAGIHRLLARLDAIRGAAIVIAVAGMEAALPSVLGGLIDRPLVAVPTSIGYGVSIDGLVALGAMLASCAVGITVVNIDNGVGAAVAAVRMARLAVAR